MGLVVSLAEALNIGWGLVASEGTASLRERLDDRAFRTQVVRQLSATSDSEIELRPARRVMASKGFINWLNNRGVDPLERFLTDAELEAVGVVDEAMSGQLGEAIGVALAAQAFEQADGVHREQFRLLGNIDETALGTFNFSQDIYELVEVIYQHLTAASPAKATRFPIRWNPRPVTSHFTGRREDLEQMEKTVAAASSTVVTQLVGGLGGAGKTQLVAKFAADQRDRFDLIAWIDASTEVSSQLADLATEIGLPGSLEDLPGVMKRWLSTTERSCLVVLDNVESPVAFEGLTPAKSVKVIATTRLNRLEGYGAQLKLGMFTSAEAIEYLQSRTNMAGPDARRVADALGYLPLALAHAGSYCAHNGTGAGDYLAILKGLPVREVYADNLDEFYLQVVHETWSASIQRVSPLSRQVLEVMAWLHPERIPIEAFGGLADSDEPRGDRLRSTKMIREAAGQLVQWSLAEWSTDGQLKVHRLLQRVVRESLYGHSASGQAISFVVDAATFDPQRRQSWHRAAQLAPHVVALMAGCGELANPAPSSVELVAAGNSCLLALVNGGVGEASAMVGDALVVFAERMLGAEHPDTLTSWGNAASSYLLVGRQEEAIDIEERIAKAFEGRFGAGHRGTLTGWGNLASSYRWAGRYEEAIAIEEQVAHQSEQSLGTEDPDTLTSWGNLAISYRLVGRYEEAIAIEERVAHQIEEFLGPEHLRTLAVWGNLASSYSAAGRFEEAIAILERVTVQCESLLGPDHPTTLAVGGQLGMSYGLVGRFDEAITILEGIAEKSERVLGRGHPDSLASWGNVAVNYRSVGRFDDAITLGERALDQSDRSLGPEHPYTLTAGVNLASSYRSVGRYDEATIVLERVAPQCERVLGPEHPTTLIAWSRLATNYRSVGRTQEVTTIVDRVDNRPGN